MDPARNVLPLATGLAEDRRGGAVVRALASLYPGVLLLGVAALELGSGQRGGALVFGGAGIAYVVLRAVRLHRLPLSPKWPLLLYALALAVTTGAGVVLLLRSAFIDIRQGDAEHVVHGSLALFIAVCLSFFTGLGILAFTRLWRLPRDPDETRAGSPTD